MKIGKAKPKGIAGYTPPRKKGDPKRSDYTWGYPTKYREEYCQSIVEYFDRDAWEIVTDMKGTPKVMPKDNVPTFTRWCRSLGIATKTANLWVAKYPEFAAAYAEAKELQKSFLIEAGLTHGSGGFAMFMLKCTHGMVEPKAETDEKDDTPIQRVVVEVVNSASKDSSD